MVVGGGLQPTSWNPRPAEDTPPGWQASILEPIGRGGHVGQTSRHFGVAKASLVTIEAQTIQ